VAARLSSALVPAGGRPTGSHRLLTADERAGIRHGARRAGFDTSRAIDEAVLDALESRRRAGIRSRHRQVLWHILVLGLAVGLFAYGLAAAPVLCVLGYLVVLGEPLVPGPTSQTAPHPLRGYVPEAGHRPSGNQRCRRHWEVRP